jgi:hypothetical protein
MKRLVAMVLAGMMVLSPIAVYADDADLEARVAALEERVAALEAQLSGQETTENQQDTGADTTDAIQTVPAQSDTFIEYEGCSLQYVDYEIVQDRQGNNVLVTYFDFSNNSEKTKSAVWSFSVKVFQHGKETGTAYLSGIQEHTDCTAEIMPGSGPLRVAYLDKLDDMSDAIVRVSPLISLGDNYIDINLSFQ